MVSLLLAAGAGYAIGAVTDDDPDPAGAALEAPDRDRRDARAAGSGREPGSDSAAAEEYQLDPNIPPADGDG